MLVEEVAVEVLRERCEFALAAGVPDIAVVGDNATAAAYLKAILRPGDVILVKASRGGQLWQITQALTGQSITRL